LLFVKTFVPKKTPKKKKKTLCSSPFTEIHSRARAAILQPLEKLYPCGAPEVHHPDPKETGYIASSPEVIIESTAWMQRSWVPGMPRDALSQ
jgi:hypothetical protein